jgi:anti-repressor protein
VNNEGRSFAKWDSSDHVHYSSTKSEDKEGGIYYMNKIQKFISEKFGTVRTIDINGVVYFVASDIAKILGYKNPQKAIRDHCKRVNETFIPSNGGEQKAKVIVKSDIYRLIARSKLGSADEFESWIFDEILPTIERTGAYIEEGREEEMISHYFSSISDDVKLLMINDLQETVKKEKSKNKELQQFYDDVLNTEGLYHTNMVAKELKIGRNTMLSYLRSKGILFYQDNSNVPYQRFMNQKLFSVVESPCADGKYRPVTYVTKKGLDYIRKLLRKDGYYDDLVTE